MSPDGPLHRLDARWKLLAAVAFAIVAVSLPRASWRSLGAMSGVLVAVAAIGRVPPSWMLKRWLGFAFVVGFLAVLTSGSLPNPSGAPRRLLVAELVARNGLAFGAMLVLAHATPWPKLLSAMRRLGVPVPLTTTLALMHRYLFVLRDELDRMTTARRARSFRRPGPAFATLAGLIGMLLFRALEREERVFDAMTARGWDGVLRTLDD